VNTDFLSLLQPALSAADAAEIPDIPASRLIPAALLGIAVIVVLITRFKLHPFLGLTLGSLTVGAVAGVAALSASGTFATFSAQTTNTGNTFAQGTLVLSDKVGAGAACLSTGAGTVTDTNVNLTCGAAFNLTVRKPGDTATANLVLKNEGSLGASALKAFSSACTDANATGETYNGTGSPCGKVQLYLQQYSDAAFTTPSACLYGGAVASTCDFSDATKTLGAFATAYPSSGSALTVGALTAGSSAYVKVGVQLPSTADNTFQGRKASVDLSWTILQ
jgi:hypothetical protein